MWLKDGIGIFIVIMIFTSYSLVEELLKKKLMRLETMRTRKDRPELPSELAVRNRKVTSWSPIAPREAKTPENTKTTNIFGLQ